MQVARDSIEEVMECKNSIHTTQLLQKHPLLHTKINITIHLYLNGELKGSYTSDNTEQSLLQNIIIGAKKAAFEDKNTEILTTSQYLHCEIQLTLYTPDGEIKEKDEALIKNLSSLNKTGDSIPMIQT